MAAAELIRPWRWGLVPNAMAEAVAPPAAVFGPFFLRPDECCPRRLFAWRVSVPERTLAWDAALRAGPREAHEASAQSPGVVVAVKPAASAETGVEHRHPIPVKTSLGTVATCSSPWRG
jgi:hypothetical protein